MSRRKLDFVQQSFGFADEDIKNSFHDEIALWVKKNATEICHELIDWTGRWDAQFIESKRQLAAETVAQRLKLLPESLAEKKVTLEKLNRGQRCFCIDQNLPQRIKDMEAELAYLSSWGGLGKPPGPSLDVRCELERKVPRVHYEKTHIVGWIDVVLSVRVLRVTAGAGPSDEYGRPYLGVDPRRYANWTAYWSDFQTFAFEAKTTIRSLGELIRQLKAYRAYSKLPVYAVSPDSRFADDVSDEGFGFIKYPDAIITFPKKSSYC